MGSTQDNTSAGLASTATKILELTSFVVANGVLIATCKPMGEWRNKNFAIFVNGRYQDQQICPIKGDWIFSYILDEGTELSSFYAIESGDWMAYDNDDSIPSGWVEEFEATNAKRLRITWDSEYRQGGISGDSQLSSVLCSGIVRWTNCQQGDLPTHARLFYSIVTEGTVHRVDWWANGALQATGSRTGDGLVSCSSVGSSGLTIQALLTYTGDVAVGNAFLECIFPSSFQIHYSPSPLTYPRTPEFTVEDDGGSTSFCYLSPVLLGSSYNYNVLAVGDNGEIQLSTAAPADSPKLLNQGPKSPTITGVTGTWAGPVVHWTEGEANCFYTIYHGYPNQPINLGEWGSPVDIVTSTGAVSWALPAVVNWTPVDRTSIINTLMASCDAAVVNLSAAFVVGQTGFLTAWNTFYAALYDAVKVYARAIEWNVDPVYYELDALNNNMIGLITASTSYDATVWKNTMGNTLANFYQTLGVVVWDEPSRWRLSGYDPTTLGEDPTYTQPDSANYSLVSLCDPVILPARVCVLVRATSNLTSIQEVADQQFCFEFDDAGNVVPLRPNEAFLNDFSSTGLALSVKSIYFTADEEVEPNYIDLYVVPTGTAINPLSPSASASVGSDVGGERRTTITKTVVASGYYDIAVMARVTATSARSKKYQYRTVLIDNSAPDGVTNLKAKVLRGNQ